MNINEQLLDALKQARISLVGFKFIPSDANAWEPHDEHALADADKAIAAAEQAPRWPQVDMGFGKFAVGSSTCAVTGAPGLIYLHLPEPREFNADCADIFPMGAAAPERSIASVIHFHSAKALQQTIDELLAIQREHYPVAEQAQQGEPVENAKLVNAIQQADAAEVAAEAERRLADPARPQAVGFFSGWVEGGEDGQPVEFMVTAYGEVPPVGAKLYTQPPSQPVAWSRVERMAADRYRVVSADDSMFYRFAVVAGDGNNQLFIGREIECRNMARRFAGAFLDGAFVAMGYSPTQPPAVAVAVPDGYALVPIEPTPEMVNAGAEGDSQFYEHAGFVYRAMLAAAPQAAVPEEWLSVASALTSQYLLRDEIGSLYCAHCMQECKGLETHRKDCPVLLARSLVNSNAIAAAQKGGE